MPLGVTPLNVAQWAVYSCYCQERHAYALSQSVWGTAADLTMRYKPVVFLNKCHLVLCSDICDLDSLYQLLAIKQPGWSIYEPGSSVRKFWCILSFWKKRLCLLLQNQPRGCLKSLSSGHAWEDFHLHLCQVLQPFIASYNLAPLGQKKPKPVIPQKGTRTDQGICSVRLSNLGSIYPWVNKGYFLSCYHIQYPLKPLFAICINIFSLYSLNIP